MGFVRGVPGGVTVRVRGVRGEFRKVSENLNSPSRMGEVWRASGCTGGGCGIPAMSSAIAWNSRLTPVPATHYILITTDARILNVQQRFSHSL